MGQRPQEIDACNPSFMLFRSFGAFSCLNRVVIFSWFVSGARCANDVCNMLMIC